MLCAGCFWDGDQYLLLFYIFLYLYIYKANFEAKNCYKAIGNMKVKFLRAGFSPSDLILQCYYEFLFGEICSRGDFLIKKKRCFFCSLHPVSDRETVRQGAWEAARPLRDPQIALAGRLSL